MQTPMRNYRLLYLLGIEITDEQDMEGYVYVMRSGLPLRRKRHAGRNRIIARNAKGWNVNA